MLHRVRDLVAQLVRHYNCAGAQSLQPPQSSKNIFQQEFRLCCTTGRFLLLQCSTSHAPIWTWCQVKWSAPFLQMSRSPMSDQNMITPFADSLDGRGYRSLLGFAYLTTSCSRVCMGFVYVANSPLTQWSSNRVARQSCRILIWAET